MKNLKIIYGSKGPNSYMPLKENDYIFPTSATL